jgi:hypothetical protein
VLLGVAGTGLALVVLFVAGFAADAAATFAGSPLLGVVGIAVGAGLATIGAATFAITGAAGFATTLGAAFGAALSAGFAAAFGAILCVAVLASDGAATIAFFFTAVFFAGARLDGALALFEDALITTRLLLLFVGFAFLLFAADFVVRWERFELAMALTPDVTRGRLSCACVCISARESLSLYASAPRL